MKISFLFSRRMLALALASMCLLLSGCGSCDPEVAPVSQESSPAARSFIRLAFVAPPPLPYEEPQRPADPMKEIWRPGYWSYDGASYEWQPGYLMPRPTTTAVWYPDHWERRSFGWTFVQGFWQ